MHAMTTRQDGRYPDFLGVECAWPAAAGFAATRTRPVRRIAPWRRLALAAAALALLGGLWQLGQAGYIHAKAWLAQGLIEQAWRDTRAGQVAVRPWPWADTWPVARLTLPGRPPLVVLAGASGRTLAFAPGHVDGSAAPGESGNVVVAGHRDTHFRALAGLVAGDELVLEAPGGGLRRYRVRETAVVDHRDTRPLLPADHARLTLVTCWPFDAVRPGGPLRWVVVADAVVADAVAAPAPRGVTSRSTGGSRRSGRGRP
jgi:sortase A